MRSRVGCLKVKEYNKQYRDNNKDSILERQRQWQRTNTKSISKYNKCIRKKQEITIINSKVAGTSGTRWCPYEDEIMLSMVENGATHTEVSYSLNRSYRGVENRLKKLRKKC